MMNGSSTVLVDYTLKKFDVPVGALFSTLGRSNARTLETKISADAHARRVQPTHGQYQT